jgi:hypothetical protein
VEVCLICGLLNEALVAFLKKWKKKKKIFPSQTGVSAIECSRPTGVKPKMRKQKLRSGLNWKGALKRKGVK